MGRTVQEDLGSAEGDRDVAVPKGRRSFRWLLKLTVSALLLTWVIGRADLSEVAQALTAADFRLVGLALALNAVGWVISVTRWRVLLGAKNVRTSFIHLLRSYLSAIFFNNLLPSTIGGDTLRVYESWALGAGRAGAIAVIGVDRLLGVLALLILALVALFMAPSVVTELPLLPLWLGGAAGALFVLATLLLASTRSISGLRRHMADLMPRRLGRVVSSLSGAFRELQQTPRATAAAVGLSFLLQLNVIGHYFLLALALNLDVAPADFAVIVPLALAVMAVPISVNAIGLRESAFTFFLGLLGVSSSQALALAWLAFGLVLVQGAIGGVVYALRRT